MTDDQHDWPKDWEITRAAKLEAVSLQLAWRSKPPASRGAASLSEIAYHLVLNRAATSFSDAIRKVIAAFDAGRFTGNGSPPVTIKFDGLDEEFTPSDLAHARRSVMVDGSPPPMWPNGELPDADLKALRHDLLDHVYVQLDSVRDWFEAKGYVWSLEMLSEYGGPGSPVIGAPETPIRIEAVSQPKVALPEVPKKDSRYYTGAPGHPTAAQYVEQELKRMIESKTRFETATACANALAAWLIKEHPTAPSMTAKTILNRLRRPIREIVEVPRS